MKKMSFKKIIAAALAVSVTAASAVLFTGCGKNEAPVMPGTQPWSAAGGAAQQETTQNKATIDLKSFREKVISEKLYTVGFDPDLQSQLPYPKFYIKAASPVEADGFTYTRISDDIRKGPNDSGFSSSWEITRDGEKYAECIFTSHWRNGSNQFSVSVEVDSTSKSVKHSSDNYVNAPGTACSIDLPPVLSADECQKHADDLQKVFDARIKKGDYADLDLKLESMYYYEGKPNETCVRALYYFVPYADSAPDYKSYVSLEGLYPFLYENTAQVTKWEQKKLKENNGNYDKWIKIK